MMKFKEIPQSKEFETHRETRFKKDDKNGIMPFSERIDISIEISQVQNYEARKELEELADHMMEEIKKIIAEHEEPR